MHRSGGQGGGQHRLVVTARDQLQHRTSGLAADSGDVGESRGPAVASGRGVDHQSGRAAGPQLFDRPAGRHPTAVHDADPVAESLDQVELMAGEQHWYTAVALLSKHLAHDVDGQRIEAGERFIQHEDVRVVHQRGGQLYPLLVAQAQLLYLVIPSARDAEPLGPGGDGGGRCGDRHPM